MIATRTGGGYDLGMTRGDTETLTVTMTVEEDGQTVPFDATEAVLKVSLDQAFDSSKKYVRG